MNRIRNIALALLMLALLVGTIIWKYQPLSHNEQTKTEAVAPELTGSLTVSANLAFEERIMRGNYWRRNSDLTEKDFPVAADQVGVWEWKLFYFNRDISSEEAIRLMREHGYEPAQIGHILTFGEKYPEEQIVFSTIGLGSVEGVGPDRIVPVLSTVPGMWYERNGQALYIFSFDEVWRRDDRFLGVRRRSVT
jgi:hypothetical protein